MNFENNSQIEIAKKSLHRGDENFKEGNLTEAVNCYNKSLIIFENITNKQYIAKTFNKLGLVYLEQREFDNEA